VTRYHAANRFQTRLAASVNESQILFIVESASGCPEVPFKLTVGTEIVDVIGVVGNVFTVQRGAEGTTPQSHPQGSLVQNRWTAGTYEDLWDDVDDLRDNMEAHVADFEAHLEDKTPHDVPRASVYHSLNQSIPNNTWTTLSFDSEHFDSENIHDSSDATKLICKTAGTYLIIGYVSFGVSSTGVRGARLLRNGGITGEVVINAPINAYAGVLISRVINLSVNNYIQMAAYQTSGGALDVGSSQTVLSMVKVG